MKRLVTILISVFVLLIAVHPVLAFHFCSGKFASIEVPSHQTSECCSETSSDNTSDQFVIQGTCCHTSVFELSTDNYLQQGSYQQTVPASVWIFAYVQSLVADIVLDSSTSPKRGAPPTYLCTEGRDLLTRFCVYII